MAMENQQGNDGLNIRLREEPCCKVSVIDDIFPEATHGMGKILHGKILTIRTTQKNKFSIIVISVTKELIGSIVRKGADVQI